MQRDMSHDLVACKSCQKSLDFCSRTPFGQYHSLETRFVANQEYLLPKVLRDSQAHTPLTSLVTGFMCCQDSHGKPPYTNSAGQVFFWLIRVPFGRLTCLCWLWPKSFYFSFSTLLWECCILHATVHESVNAINLHHHHPPHTHTVIT